MDKPEYSLKEPEKKDPIQDNFKQAKIANSAIKPDSEGGSESTSLLGLEYFKVTGWPELLLNPKLDSNKVVDKVAYIEDFFKNICENEGLTPDSKSYEQIIKSLESQLNLMDIHDPNLRIQKVFSLVKVLEKDQAHKERKKSIFSLLNQNK